MVGLALVSKILTGVLTTRLLERVIALVLGLPNTIDQVVFPPEAILDAPKEWLILGKSTTTRLLVAPAVLVIP
jgi:hypothetical protein